MQNSYVDVELVTIGGNESEVGVIAIVQKPVNTLAPVHQWR